MTRHETSFLFALDHPTAGGHFPGHPIIPGALLLDQIAVTIGERSDTSCTIRAAKFLHPVKPGERVTLYWHTSETGETKFDCLLEDTPVLTGTMSFNHA